MQLLLISGLGGMYPLDALIFLVIMFILGARRGPFSCLIMIGSDCMGGGRYQVAGQSNLSSEVMITDVGIVREVSFLSGNRRSLRVDLLLWFYNSFAGHPHFACHG